jgi:hypothetical protein
MGQCDVLEQLERRLLLSAIFVDLNAPGPAHDGLSWGSAFTDLQLALQSAISRDEIRIADGTYRPTSGTDRAISFQLRNGIAINGGFAGFGGG